MTSSTSRLTAIRYSLVAGIGLLFLATAWEVTGAIQRSDLNHEFDSRTARTILASPVIISVDGRSKESGTAGGVIILSSGTILTNSHLVEGATMVEIRRADGGHSQGHVVRQDPRTDLAIIQPVDSGTQWSPLHTGDSDRARVGDQVFLITATPSGGALRRGRITDLYPTQRDVRLIQTSIPIRADEAGSALVNMQGQIIGIMTITFAGDRSMATAVNSAKDLVLSMTASPHPSTL